MKAKTIFSALALSAILPLSAAASGAWNPGTYAGYVSANSDEIFVEVFEGGYVGEVVLEGDCQSDIDLWIYDEFGHLIAKSTSYGCDEYVRFVPAWTGEFVIKVENSGKPNGSRFWLTTL